MWPLLRPSMAAARSRFTGLPTASSPRLVTRSVSGATPTVNCCLSNLVTVRHTPFTAIEQPSYAPSSTVSAFTVSVTPGVLMSIARASTCPAEHPSSAQRVRSCTPGIPHTCQVPKSLAHRSLPWIRSNEECLADLPQLLDNASKHGACAGDPIPSPPNDLAQLRWPAIKGSSASVLPLESYHRVPTVSLRLPSTAARQSGGLTRPFSPRGAGEVRH
jgi:hypothetical protein